MFTLDSEATLRATFRPRDRSRLELPAGMKFPVGVRQYLAWSQPAGTYRYLVFQPRGGVPTGVVFRRSQSPTDPPVGHLCDWCRSTGTSDLIGLLTADRNSKKRVGVNICLDLGCNQRAEDAALRSGRSVVEAFAELLERIARFASEGLGIDLSGAGR